MNFLENACSGNARGSDGDAMHGDIEQELDAQPKPWQNRLTAILPAPVAATRRRLPSLRALPPSAVCLAFDFSSA
jgi:hypothetical protein